MDDALFHHSGRRDGFRASSAFPVFAGKANAVVLLQILRIIRLFITLLLAISRHGVFTQTKGRDLLANKHGLGNIVCNLKTETTQVFKSWPAVNCDTCRGNHSGMVASPQGKSISGNAPCENSRAHLARPKGNQWDERLKATLNENHSRSRPIKPFSQVLGSPLWLKALAVRAVGQEDQVLPGRLF